MKPSPPEASSAGASEAEADDALLFQFFLEVGIISQLASNAADRALPDGVTLAQFSLLNHLTRLGGPKSPNALAASFQVTKGAITHIMQKLEARGALTVTPDPEDGRAKRVDLTDAGRALHALCLERLATLYAPIRAAISRGDIEAALPSLERMRRLLDEKAR